LTNQELRGKRKAGRSRRGASPPRERALARGNSSSKGASSASRRSYRCRAISRWPASAGGPLVERAAVIGRAELGSTGLRPFCLAQVVGQLCAGDREEIGPRLHVPLLVVVRQAGSGTDNVPPGPRPSLPPARWGGSRRPGPLTKASSPLVKSIPLDQLPASPRPSPARTCRTSQIHAHRAGRWRCPSRGLSFATGSRESVDRRTPPKDSPTV